MALVLVITCWWSWGANGSILHGIELVYGQAASLLAGSLFAYGLRRTAQRIIEFQHTQQRQIASEQARKSSAEHRDLELARVRARAESALLQIASGKTSSAEREEHRLLEASLRDEIRGRSLAIEPVTSAARGARKRGIDVLLLDDSGDLAPTGQAAVTIAAWAADRIKAATSTAIFVRLAVHDGRLTTTVASGDDTVEPEALILEI